MQMVYYKFDWIYQSTRRRQSTSVFSFQLCFGWVIRSATHCWWLSKCIRCNTRCVHELFHTVWRWALASSRAHMQLACVVITAQYAIYYIDSINVHSQSNEYAFAYRMCSPECATECLLIIHSTFNADIHWRQRKYWVTNMHRSNDKQMTSTRIRSTHSICQRAVATQSDATQHDNTTWCG